MISESKMFDSAYCPCSLAIAAVKRSPYGRFITGISSVVLLLLVLSPLAHAARDHGHYPSSLQVVLTPADEADHVSITASNMSDKPVTFLGWDTPFEADVLADVFDISVPEKGFLPVNRIKYAGPLPRRGLPDESAWMESEIVPGAAALWASRSRRYQVSATMLRRTNEAANIPILGLAGII